MTDETRRTFNTPPGAPRPADPNTNPADPRSATPGYVPPANVTAPGNYPGRTLDGDQLPPLSPAPYTGPPYTAVSTATTPGGSTAFAKLRAFEDQYFGRDVPRINGEIERGVGSRYAAMTPHQKAHYSSLEHLVRSERAMGDAAADMELSKARHETAVRNSDIAAKAIVTADAAAKTEADRLAADQRNPQNRPGYQQNQPIPPIPPNQQTPPNQAIRQNLPGEVNWNTATPSPSEPGHTGQAATPATPWANNQPGNPTGQPNPGPNSNPPNRAA